VVSIDYATANGQDDTATLLRTLRERFKGGLDDAVVDILPIRRPPESNLRSAVVAVAPRERCSPTSTCSPPPASTPRPWTSAPPPWPVWPGRSLSGDPRANLLLINFGTEHTTCPCCGGAA
jgi:hypothetical protein